MPDTDGQRASDGRAPQCKRLFAAQLRATRRDGRLRVAAADLADDLVGRLQVQGEDGDAVDGVIGVLSLSVIQMSFVKGRTALSKRGKCGPE